MKRIGQLCTVLIMVLFAFVSCSKSSDGVGDVMNLKYKDLKIIEIGDYAFHVPSHFKVKEDQGIDSYVGRLFGSGIVLIFDFGVYTNPGEGFPEDLFDVYNETFGSVERQIVVPKDPLKYSTSIHIRDLNNFSPLGNYVSLSMSTHTITKEQQDLVVKILKSAELIE